MCDGKCLTKVRSIGIVPLLILVYSTKVEILRPRRPVLGLSLWMTVEQEFVNLNT
jgi:hypothetical protein